MPKSSTSSAGLTQRGPSGSGDGSRATFKRKPKATSFHQQTMWAVQPVLSPRWIISALILIGLVFIPLGIVQIVLSARTQEYGFDYTDCLWKAPRDAFSEADLAQSSFSTPFQWRRTGDDECQLKFTIPQEMVGPVFMYYRLTNFYQNNRLYSRSISYQQLRGDALSYSQLKESCDPLSGPDTNGNDNDKKEVVYYPCGLIANSLFSDTFSGLHSEAEDLWYGFPAKDIVWPGDQRYVLPSKYGLDDVRAPPGWRHRSDVDSATGRYRGALPDLGRDERFLNWIRLSGLPTFRKLYGKYDGRQPIPKGPYTIDVQCRYDVKGYGGRKALILAQTNAFGGSSPALGIVCLVVGGLFLLLGIAFLVKHLVSPRLEGDVRYLPWYQPVVDQSS